jgi:hypothetical protein
MRFRLTAPDGRLVDEGEGTVELAAGALVVSPPFGQPLRIAPADVVEIAEPEQYGIRLVLRDGILDLTQLGRMRGQLLAELADARATDTTKTLLLDGVGRPEIFPGAVDDADAELRLYDDALVTLPAHGDPDKLPYPFIRSVAVDGYRLTLDVTGREPLTLSRLARRTTEFADLLRDRVGTAAGRTSAFLGALLPGLGALALREVAGRLRDGVAAPQRDLDAIDPTVWPSLVAAAALAERAAGLAALADLGELWIGFTQTVSVQRDAVGVQPWHDPSVGPTFQHDGGAGSFAPGLGGMLGAGMVSGGLGYGGLGFDGPFQAYGSMLALQFLGTAAGAQHAIRPRADVRRGLLTPASTDYGALTATGEQPTVLAFAFCLTESGALVYEVLNEPDHATYLYRADSADHAAALNRALDLIGFRVSAVHTDADQAGSPYRKAAERLPALRLLREAYLGRVGHTEGWADRLRAALSGTD